MENDSSYFVRASWFLIFGVYDFTMATATRVMTSMTMMGYWNSGMGFASPLTVPEILPD